MRSDFVSTPREWHTCGLVEETEHLATDLLAPRLFVVQDTVRGGQHDDAEQTRGKQTADPVLDVGVRQIVTGAIRFLVGIWGERSV